MGRSAKTIREGWKPFTAEVARVLARKAAQAFAMTERAIAVGESKCLICNHPNREAVDIQILVNAPIKKRKEPLGELAKNWGYGRFVGHRNHHLLPLIATEVVPKIAALAKIPFPRGGTLVEQEQWYFDQLYGIYIEALDSKQPARAITALMNMREIGRALDNLGVERATPVVPLPPPNSAPPIRLDRDPEKIQRAFKRSVVKRPIIPTTGDIDNAEIG